LKILHSSDLHFNKNWFKWLSQQQNDIDIFCISGDLLESSKDETLLEQINWLKDWIRQFQKPLFICSGNHDIEELDNEDWLNQIDTSNYYPDNVIQTIENIKFGCYPYLGADGYYEFDECDILITHVPPARTDTSTDKNKSDWGDNELSNAIKNKIIHPKIILCGHMHKPINNIYSIDNTTIYNPGVGKNNLIPNYHILEI